jgi:hypothetical protein
MPAHSLLNSSHQSDIFEHNDRRRYDRANAKSERGDSLIQCGDGGFGVELGLNLRELPIDLGEMPINIRAQAKHVSAQSLEFAGGHRASRSVRAVFIAVPRK